MINKVIILTDYKKRFGSKHFDVPYRSGMDLSLLQNLFSNSDFETQIIPLSEISYSLHKFDKDVIFIYTSSEDNGYHYKSFIEDIILFIESSGYTVLPDYKYLRANNNKVFMELLRDSTMNEELLTIKSRSFGVYEEMYEQIDTVNFPVVLKASEGAKGNGVFKANNKKELISKSKKLAATKNIFHDLKEIGRSIKHKGYKKESKYRNKFIVQNFIPNLSNDWKVLVYGNRCYVLFRGIPDGDFRASGSGNFEFRRDIPEGILDYAMAIKEHFDVPNISLDIGYNGSKFHLIEFQFLYFGTTTIVMSEHYYLKDDESWLIIEEKSSLEEVYVDSIVKFIQNK